MRDGAAVSEQQFLPLPADPVAKPTRCDLGCGCRLELDSDSPVWVTAPCAEHATDHSGRLMTILGMELDDLVAAACRGRPHKPCHLPKDPFR
jgi:hypothetical protein